MIFKTNRVGRFGTSVSIGNENITFDAQGIAEVSEEVGKKLLKEFNPQQFEELSLQQVIPAEPLKTTAEERLALYADKTDDELRTILIQQAGISPKLASGFTTREALVGKLESFLNS